MRCYSEYKNVNVHKRTLANRRLFKQKAESIPLPLFSFNYERSFLCTFFGIFFVRLLSFMPPPANARKNSVYQCCCYFITALLF